MPIRAPRASSRGHPPARGGAPSADPFARKMVAAAAASPSGELYLPPEERKELLGEVQKSDDEAEAARQGNDQQTLLVRLEQGLFLRQRLYVETHAEVAAASRRLCKACNFAATSMLQQDNLKAAQELLKRAEQVAEKSDHGDHDRAITWNNLACYYRRTGKLRSAVTFLERALAIEEHQPGGDVAQTHLNLCATLSQLERHTDALHHAQSALIRSYEFIVPLMQLTPGSSESQVSDLQEQITVLCIAYHNLAVEHEYRKKYESALCSYAEGLRWASRFLAP